MNFRARLKAMYLLAAEHLADEAELYGAQTAYMSSTFANLYDEDPDPYMFAQIYTAVFQTDDGSRFRGAFDDWLEDLDDSDNCDCRTLACLMLYEMVDTLTDAELLEYARLTCHGREDFK